MMRVYGCLVALLLTARAAADPLPNLVSPQWLADQLNADDLVVVDSSVVVYLDDHKLMRNRSGRDRYQTSHIPGAVFADILTVATNADSSTGTDLSMPTAEAFAAFLGELGISNTDRVVVYSTENHAWAAYFWWLMDWIGHEQVAILDGGFGGWEAAGLAVSAALTEPETTQYTPSPRPELISDTDTVRRSLADSNTVLLDALPSAHYQGQFALYDRPGHIPGARNIPTSELLDVQGRYRPIEELQLLADLPPDTRAITYCGGGVAASSLAFALRQAGYEEVSVYMGSLAEWSADPSNPLVTGDLPESQATP